MTNWNRVGSGVSLMKVLWWHFLKGTEEKLKKNSVQGSRCHGRAANLAPHE